MTMTTRLSTWMLNGRRCLSQTLEGVVKDQLNNDVRLSRYRCFSKNLPLRCPNPSKHPSVLRRYGPKAFLFAAVTGSYAYVRWSVEVEKQDLTFVEQKKALKESGMGGDWQLERVSDGTIGGSADFLGDFALLYFGFTNCPDICPDEIAKAISVVDAVDEVRKNSSKYKRLVPVFVTLDPARDTRAVVKNYVAEFSPKMLGYVGTEEQIADVAHRFRVYYGKGPVDEDGDYVVDHSIIMYLVGPDGLFLDYYGQSKKGEEMTTSVLSRIQRWEKEERKNERKFGIL